MEIIAQSLNIRIAPRKVRLVADAIRNLPIDQALNRLLLIRKRGAPALYETVKSAIANALNNAKLDRNNLIIKKIEVSEGSRLKRYRPSTRGRVHPYKKRSSHIKIILTEKGAAYGAKN